MKSGQRTPTRRTISRYAPLCKAKSSLKSRQVKSSASQQMQIRGSRSITTLLNKLHANFCLPARSDLLPRLSEACLYVCAAVCELVRRTATQSFYGSTEGLLNKGFYCRSTSVPKKHQFGELKLHFSPPQLWLCARESSLSLDNYQLKKVFFPGCFQSKSFSTLSMEK